MLKGHLPNDIYCQVYYYTKMNCEPSANRLESLNVSDNHLATLYLEFAFMPKLTDIVREDNDWRYPQP